MTSVLAPTLARQGCHAGVPAPQPWSGWKLCAIAMCVVVPLAALCSPAVVHAAKVSDSVSFGGSRSLDVTLWYPTDRAVLRGVVVFTGGQADAGSGDTRDRADSAFWQAFGQSLGFGVLGTQFTGSYTDAASGPGDALLEALRGLGEQIGHPELSDAPLLLEGFSNGGYFSYTFTHYRPERVIAFCLNKSGFASAPLDPPFLAVPGFLIWGSDEPPGTPTVIHSLVEQGRAQHALWAELREWNRSHEEGRVEPAFAPFFAEMVALRYPGDADPSAGPVELLALQEESGWLGDHGDTSVAADVPTIAAWADYAADKSAASWLPSEGMAKLWRGFVTQNPLSLDQPRPGTPYAASQPLDLGVSGLDAAVARVAFYDQHAPLVSDVSASGPDATASWDPAWGGVRGVAAVASNSAGDVLRVSRPAHVVLTGMAPPGGVSVDPGAGDLMDAGIAADGGAGDAGQPAEGAAGSGVAGQRSRPTGRAGAGGVAAPDAVDSGTSESASPDSDAGAARPSDSSDVRGSCSCRVSPGATRRGGAEHAVSGLDAGFGLGCALGIMIALCLRSRRRVGRGAARRGSPPVRCR